MPPRTGAKRHRGRKWREINRRARARAKGLIYGRAFPHEVYDPGHHPQDVLNWFRERYEALSDPENVERAVLKNGDIRYAVKPCRAPTVAGYAAHAGVSVPTIDRWRLEYPKFGEELEKAKAYEGAFFVELAGMNGFNPQVAIMALKNLQGWRDKSEVDLGSSVTLRFDEQDEDA